MRRALVLTNEAARHPFRQQQPRHIFENDARPDETAPVDVSDDNDWKLFLLSFAAFFTVAYTFIV